MTHCTQNNPQFDRKQPSAQRVITRHNGLVFYGLAAASFLETAIPLHASALLDIFSGDENLRCWIENTWWPVKSAHARETRACVEALWPEFDWGSAYGEFYEAYRPLVCAGRSAGGPAREALARSVSASQTAAIYRCLGTTADDPQVRRLLYSMSADEAAHFDRFRRAYEHLGRRERLGLLASYRTIVTCAKRARDVDVQLAYARLNAPHWYGGTPFPELSYRDFVLRMGGVVRRHLKIGPSQRLLFRPWFKARRMSLPPAPMPVLQKSAPMTGRQLQLDAVSR